jgi:hypothetical protein
MAAEYGCPETSPRNLVTLMGVRTGTLDQCKLGLQSVVVASDSLSMIYSILRKETHIKRQCSPKQSNRLNGPCCCSLPPRAETRIMFNVVVQSFCLSCILEEDMPLSSVKRCDFPLAEDWSIQSTEILPSGGKAL